MAGNLTTQSVEHRGAGHLVVFPVQRWVKAKQRYKVWEFDCFLPQCDPDPQGRRNELEEKRASYRYKAKFPGGPVQVAKLPDDEKFSDDYYIDFAKNKAKLLLQRTWIKWNHNERWSSIDELLSLYKMSFHQPIVRKINHSYILSIRNKMETTMSATRWKEDSWFGLERVQGVNPFLIRLCTAIPDKFGIREEELLPHLGGMSLAEALEAKRLFIIDLEALKNVSVKPNTVLCSPLALFFRNRRHELMPVAIQLFQEKAPDNPVFTPSDPPYTWLLAKMYYSNADATYHQSFSHLGYTHLLMEGCVVCTHRNLSVSHPVFKLLAPHFLFLLAINARGLEKLICKGGWVDKTMTVGVEGMFELIARGVERWRMNVEGNVRNELEARGVLDPEVLPYYPYRDDAVEIYDAIHLYVREVVPYIYDSDEQVREDWELQQWRLELSRGKEAGGVGLHGVPGSDTQGFNDREELIQTLTVIISGCSLGHASTNFQQYDAYGFPPNYPGMLIGHPPKDKEPRTEEDILQVIPSKNITCNTMVITKLLSMKGTKSLGDFEVQYLYHPAILDAVQKFRRNLEELSKRIQERNATRVLPYPYLDPIIIPNSISI
ncbi:unnamed protein product [Darwinula stevensoni]|uniref:Lipoxygenase domain-containing protein n=1 Tax=Darwinula stevensoni TaxID=69355 RepID=A0A7R8X435_9CRUS|nr:unnamed protein product [Darwinula stevensoni]CAG0885599.1 unnamed protein product [Darwinula stevensoni]